MNPTLITAFSGLTPILGWTLAHFLWQGALVGLVLKVALSACRTAKGRHDACLVALLALAALPVLTFVLLRGQVRVVAVPAGSAALIGQGAFTWERLAVAGWLVGVLALGVRTLGGLVLIERLRRGALPLPPAWAERCAALQRRMGGRLKVVFAQSHAIAAPVVAGWLRPMVLIPAAALVRLPVDQLEALILHELAHVRRLDAFANLIQAVVETALFYHPVVWWVSWRLRMEREHCCDDLAVAVIRDPAVFVRALQAMEAMRPAGALPGAGLLAANGGSLKGRAARLLGMGAAERPALSRSAAILVLSLGAVAMATSVGVQAEPTRHAPLQIALVEPQAQSAPAPAAEPAPKRVVYVAAAPVAKIEAQSRPEAAPPPNDARAQRRDAMLKLFAAREALGALPPDSDPVAQANWRSRDLALTAELDQMTISSEQSQLEDSKRGIAASAAGDPAAQTRRLNQIEMLDTMAHETDLRTLHAHAATEASQAYAAAAIATAPAELAAAKAKAADAERAVKVLDKTMEDEFFLRASRFQPPEVNGFWTMMHNDRPKDLPPPPANGSAMGDTLSGVANAIRAGRPIRALDYLEDAMRDGQATTAAAEKAARRRSHTSPPTLTLAQFRALTERVRLESIALRAIREEVGAGHRPAADLDSAEASLKAAQTQATDAIEQARRTTPAERQILHQVHLAVAATYQTDIRKIEVRLPTLSTTEQAEADRAISRLRYEVMVQQRMAAEALKLPTTPAPIKVQLPSAETGSAVRFGG